MEIDMHYGAIYYLASLAKIGDSETEKIAWSSQFVDDAKYGGTLQFGGGEGYLCANSAHRHLTDNLSAHTRLVWIPFHFMPDPEEQGPYLQRLECVKDGQLARNAVMAAIHETDMDVRPYRFGIALHAYADTWSHWGFSGLPSDTNLVSHVRPLNVEQSIFEESLSWVATAFPWGKDMNPIGHMYASTCPDLPYLEWEYVEHGRSDPVKPHRMNASDYKLASENLYAFMMQFNGSSSGLSIPKDHKITVNKLIDLKEDDKETRLAEWTKHCEQAFGRHIPAYDGEGWITDAIGEGWKTDVCITLSGMNYQNFKKTHYWRFCQGLRKHLTYIVEELAKGGISIL